MSFQLDYINRKPGRYVKNIIHEAEKKCDELYMNSYQIPTDRI